MGNCCVGNSRHENDEEHAPSAWQLATLEDFDPYDSEASEMGDPMINLHHDGTTGPGSIDEARHRGRYERMKTRIEDDELVELDFHNRTSNSPDTNQSKSYTTINMERSAHSSEVRGSGSFSLHSQTSSSTPSNQTEVVESNSKSEGFDQTVIILPSEESSSIYESAMSHSTSHLGGILSGEDDEESTQNSPFVKNSESSINQKNLRASGTNNNVKSSPLKSTQNQSRITSNPSITPSNYLPLES